MKMTKKQTFNDFRLVAAADNAGDDDNDDDDVDDF